MTCWSCAASNHAINFAPSLHGLQLMSLACRSVQELMFRANVKCQAANKLDAYMRRPRSSLLVSPEVKSVLYNLN